MRHPAAFVAFVLLTTPSFAATDQECRSLWKTADVDANGALTRAEDKGGYIASVEKSGGKLLQADTLSRDEFLSYCRAGFATATTQSPENTKDFGKGDLTPGTHPLSKDDALKKFEASGFKDVRDVNLDEKGIWRGTAFADGKNKPVAVDPQGDVVADKGSNTPQSNSMTNAGQAPPAQSHVQPSEPPREVVASVESGRHAGTMLWLWIIIANAVGIIVLSNWGGPTSAMGNGGSLERR